MERIHTRKGNGVKSRFVTFYRSSLLIQSHEELLDVPDGEKTRLHELQALAKQNNYADLDDKTKDELKALLSQARGVRKKTTRNRATAVIHDVRATTARVFDEVSAFDVAST